ncbi:MAG: hypothetical protein LBG19_07440 [Prevotellaceae bacterium]|jgi:hypothetical protein|nr:hypothetical protein [Prevotellaceae bacterium]
MTRKNIFAEQEAYQIRRSLKQLDTLGRGTLKNVRQKLRNIGFYISDYHNGFSAGDFDIEVRSGRINIIENSSSSTATQSIQEKPKKQISQINKPQNTDLKSLTANSSFVRIPNIDLTKLDMRGFHRVRLRKESKFPNEYQKYLLPDRLLYIGKAEGQTLRKRFYNQEPNAIGRGTFFRSIGAVLGYRPEKGSLKDKSNKKNYTFSPQNEISIINWMRENLEVSWIKFDGDFSIEKDLISTHTPLLNWTYNPKKLKELERDRKLCRSIANAE